MENGAPTESHDGVEKGLKKLQYVYFEDNAVQRLILPRFLQNKGYQNIVAHDTSAYPSDATMATSFEQNIINGADIVITDINDGSGVDNSNGGMRRGRYALEQGKKVIFVTGNVFNENTLHAAFRDQYAQSYTVLFKPVGSDELEKAILGLTRNPS